MAYVGKEIKSGRPQPVTANNRMIKPQCMPLSWSSLLLNMIHLWLPLMIKFFNFVYFIYYYVWHSASATQLVNCFFLESLVGVLLVEFFCCKNHSMLASDIKLDCNFVLRLFSAFESASYV